MSAQSEVEGYNHYMDASSEDRQWFEKQWAVWPVRADKERTINIGFLYGGVCAYRSLNNCDPDTSSSFAEHVSFKDGDAA